MTTTAASAALSSKPPPTQSPTHSSTHNTSTLSTTLTPSSSVPLNSFTPLESFFLSQSILQHGVEPDAFVRIAAVLQNNAFIRSDESYSADRLTADSLQQLFLHLLDEVAAEGAGRTESTDAAVAKTDDIESKKRKAAASPLSTATAAISVPLKAAHVLPEQLPILVERLYVRYREHIVDAIRKDERQVEKIQGEIRVLEQQASGGGGRGAHARAVAAAAAAARVNNGNDTATHNGRQQQLQHAQAAAHFKNGPHSSRSATSTSAASAPLLPASSRSGTETSLSAGPSSSRATASPTLQQQQHHQLQQNHAAPLPRASPQLAPYPPSTLSQSPSRTSTVAPMPAATAGQLATGSTHDNSKLSPAGQAARPSQPGSRSMSPVHLAHQQTLPQQQRQHYIPIATGKNAGTSLGSSASPTQTPGPLSPSKTLPSQQIAFGQPTSQRTETPRPLFPATQMHAPIGAGQQTPVQLQRPPVGQSAPAGVAALGYQPPSTAAVGGLRDSATLHGLSTRPLLPEHVRGGPPSRTPTPVQSPRPLLPHTPVHGIGIHSSFIPRGSGTRWKPSEPTPSTPGPDVGDMASPAYEPLSPVQKSAVSMSRAGSADATEADTSSVSPSAVVRQPRNLRRPHQPHPSTAGNNRTVRSGARPSRYVRQNGGGGGDNTDDDGNFAIKDEESTPRAFDDGTDVDVDDNANNVNSRALLKRKRRDDSAELAATSIDANKPDASVLARRRLVGPPTPPTHVLWMRGFPKISASALDQISSHRHANMFAHKIRDRDAPGYGSIVRHPVDLKSIRMAITHGNKAATAMAASLAESVEQQSEESPPSSVAASAAVATAAAVAAGASSVWLPISEDLVPPRGIINSSQLECELVHMFANAVMYNPDSHRGPGPTFSVGEDGDYDEFGESNASGGGGNGGDARYEVDEDGVVNDTRDMYVEVEKLLSEMRSAERQRGMPPPPPGSKGLDLPLDEVDITTERGSSGVDQKNEPKDNGKDADDDKGDGDDDALASTDVDAEGSGTVKRRRVTRAQ